MKSGKQTASFHYLRSKTTKANKNPPVLFNCTFYVTAMHSINFVLNTPQVISHCFLLSVSKCTLSKGLAPQPANTDTQIPDPHIKNCLENSCRPYSHYTVAYLEGEVVMRKNFLIPCILIIFTEFNSELHLLQRVLANSPEDNPKALLIYKELSKTPHIDNIFFFLSSTGIENTTNFTNTTKIYKFSVLVASFLLVKQGRSSIKGGAWL